ncbi:MAG: tetratricopeptide repeat protein [Chloroflexi bacterium]|nr:tetratricopeptide repeat protein [Chloroflexota bacterium]
MAASTPYKAPFSGPVIGAIVKALGLQVVALQSKTAKRYFSGKRVKDYNKHEICAAVGKALVAHGIMPSSFILEQEGFTLEQVISPMIAWYADQWDQLVGNMRSTSAPVDRPDLAAISYLRLAVVDIALRASAVLWLTEATTPDEGTPLWAREKGGAEYLRRLLDKCGESRPTRDELANRLNVSYNTVDNWLDTITRPSRSNIDLLAEELAPRIPDIDVKTLRCQLHRHYALCALCDLLANHLGRDVVIDLATVLVRFTSRSLAGFRQLSEPVPDDIAKHQLFILLLGSQAFSSEHVLEALWRQERDRVWQADLMAASKPWHLRLTHVAQHLGGLDEALRRIHDEYGIPIETIKGQMDKVLHDVQADLTRPGVTDQSELEGMTLVRVKGDARFSARNRMTQFAQARSEGDLETAILHVRRAVELQPENAEYHFHLGANLGMVGEIEEGIQECWLAVQLNPTWELPRVEVGIILLNAGRSQEAREHLESIALGQDTLSAHLALNLGVARFRCGEPAGALDVLEKAIAVEPDHALALNIAAHCAFLGRVVKVVLSRAPGL